MRKVLAISGRPGTGKSTLMKKFMESHSWEVIQPVPLLNSLYCSELDLYVFGKYEDGETFPGTDKLSMAVQPQAVEFIKNTKSNILFEGDRLTTSSFYDFLLELPETNVFFLVLQIKEDSFKERYATRGSDQNEQFLRSRETKINNILNNMDYWDNTVKMDNNNLEDQKMILTIINNYFK